MNCSLCDTSLHQQITTNFYRCPTCKSYVKNNEVFLNSSLEVKRYLTHNNDVNDPRYRNFTSPISKHILHDFTPQHLGLDYGCGTGPVIAKVLEENDFQINLYDPFFYPLEANLAHTYDYIACCEVAEHFYTPKKEFLKLNRLLNSGGKLYIMTQMFEEQTQEFSDWYYIKDPTHVFIYTYPTFEYIAKHFGFRVQFESNRFIILQKIKQI
ncbi:MAG: class I SAM-dependent methyltransferase [Flavobacteriaceae bacterium]|nr:class I SAM-dependent methyltransferase [Flavobacteriaceae bacterium]